MARKQHPSIIFIDSSKCSFITGCDEHEEFREVFTTLEIARKEALKHREILHNNRGPIRIQE